MIYSWRSPLDKKTASKNGNSEQETKIKNNLLVMEKAIENSTSPIIFIDLDWNVTYANPAFLGLLGYNTEDEVLGKTVTGF